MEEIIILILVSGYPLIAGTLLFFTLKNRETWQPKNGKSSTSRVAGSDSKRKKKEGEKPSLFPKQSL